MGREFTHAREAYRALLASAHLVDPQLNYGREIVSRYLSAIAPYHTVIDLGAGSGYDIEAAASICPTARIMAVEAMNHTPTIYCGEESRCTQSISSASGSPPPMSKST